MLKIGFIGAGKMAQAMAKGMIAAGLTKGENIVAGCAPQDPHCKDAFQNFGAQVSFENHSAINKSDIVFLAVKPNVMPEVLADIRPLVSSRHLLLSVAMGVSIRELEQGLPQGSRVVRVMPNTPCLVRSGASVFVTGSSCGDGDAATTSRLLEAVGTVDRVSEHLLDAVTALSGSGPAYVYLVIEALAGGGVKMGLPHELAYKLAAQTVMGAGKMVAQIGAHPAQLRDDVTSPGGSTSEGLHFLEKSGTRAAFIGAVEAATRCCSETRGH